MTTANELLRSSNALAAQGDTANAERLKATAGFYLASHMPRDPDLADGYRRAIKLAPQLKKALKGEEVRRDYQYKPGTDYGPGTPPPLRIKPRIDSYGRVTRRRYTESDAGGD